jgi:hypothetical protein
MSRRRIGAVALTGLVLVVQGCATAKPIPYGPIADKQPWGYSDKVNADGGHTVLYVMPGGTAAKAVRERWDQRAGEVCPDGIARQNIFRVDHPNSTVQGYAYGSIAPNSRVYTGAEVEGYVYCKPADSKPAAPSPSTNP